MDLNRIICDHLAEGGKGALATIVRKAGAAPRDKGTQMFVTAGGKIYGTIGGGLMEADVLRTAMDVIVTGRHQIIHLSMDGQRENEGGMICGGNVDVFVESVDDRQKEVYEAIRNAIKRDAKGVIVTRYSDSEFSKSLLLNDGTVAGDPLDHAVSARLSANGEKLMLEEGLIAAPIFVRSRLYIFGAGHVSQYVCRIADIAGFDVIVIDDRADYCNRTRFPEAKETVTEAFDTVFDRLPFDGTEYVVIATRGHKHDALVLCHVLRRQTRYVGMIGSARKTKMVFSHLRAEGTEERILAQVYAPIGLDIGSETPQEIAVSIVAELIKVRRRQNVGREPSGVRDDQTGSRSHRSPDHHKILFG